MAKKTKEDWDEKIPEGWKRVTRGTVREGDLLWRYPPGMFVDAPGDGEFGDSIDKVYCCIREIREKGGAAKPAPAKPERKYVLIEKDVGGVPLEDRLCRAAMDIRGIFGSPEEAEAWVKADAEENYVPCDAEGDPEAWGQDFVLCEIVGILRPVPRVTVKVEVQRRDAL